MQFKIGGILLTVFLLYGCSTFKPVPSEQLQPPDIPERFEIRGVPFFEQEAYQCGPAVLAMALAWAGATGLVRSLGTYIWSPPRGVYHLVIQQLVKQITGVQE